MKRLLLPALLSVLTAACSGEDPESRPVDDHVWKSQTDALEQARDIGNRADEESRRRERLLNEAGE
ncbi:MAG TPA: hypothetical protein ENI93_06290 [Gammaproteobacteria bacterium]|nr:hypothetical protein [Gammaproteobacteria bacterium]